MDKNKLKFTNHAKLRACERLLGITNPTEENLKNIRTITLRVTEWSELHNMFIVPKEHVHIEKLLFMKLDGDKVVTIRPFSELHYKGAKGLRKVVNKKKEKY